MIKDYCCDVFESLIVEERGLACGHADSLPQFLVVPEVGLDFRVYEFVDRDQGIDVGQVASGEVGETVHEAHDAGKGDLTE